MAKQNCNFLQKKEGAPKLMGHPHSFSSYASHPLIVRMHTSENKIHPEIGYCNTKECHCTIEME